ncbi:hypothetical protein KA005_36905, partial [bacterium]|nr:hypothetical protein [bacterium]
YVLAEVQEMDVYQLFRRCAELSVKYDVSCFYGRRDQAMIHVFNLWCRNSLEQRTAVFDFNTAPFSDDSNISYHMNVVKSLLLPERKILHMSDVIESPKLPAYIQSLSPNATATDIEYPAVAALGYAVTLLVEFRHDDYEEEEKGRSIDDHDPCTGY